MQKQKDVLVARAACTAVASFGGHLNDVALAELATTAPKVLSLKGDGGECHSHLHPRCASQPGCGHAARHISRNATLAATGAIVTTRLTHELQFTNGHY